MYNKYPVYNKKRVSYPSESNMSLRDKLIAVVSIGIIIAVVFGGFLFLILWLASQMDTGI